MAGMDATWDGLPVAREPPYAACVVVWREGADGRELLILHRLAPGGAGYEGDWAWTPPSGARQPGEPPGAAARRELREETGLALPLRAVSGVTAPGDLALYVAEAPSGIEIVLDDEHDAFAWLPLEEAARRCLPAEVGASLRRAAAALEG